MSHSVIDTAELGGAVNRYGPTAARQVSTAPIRLPTTTVDTHAHILIAEAAKYIAPHYNLGNTLSELKRWAEAEAAHREAVCFDPDLAAAHHHLGAVLQARGELAQAEGIKVGWIRLLFMLLLASTVAIGMKVVGALLITAMLIIPAAAARKLASTPEQMALLASAIGMGSVLCGLLLSWLASLVATAETPPYSAGR